MQGITNDTLVEMLNALSMSMSTYGFNPYITRMIRPHAAKIDIWSLDRALDDMCDEEVLSLQSALKEINTSVWYIDRNEFDKLCIASGADTSLYIVLAERIINGHSEIAAKCAMYETAADLEL